MEAPPPPPCRAVSVLVVKFDATISFRRLFCCQPASRLHLSPLLFMSPLTTCSPHSSTFSQRPQSLLLSYCSSSSSLSSSTSFSLPIRPPHFSNFLTFLPSPLNCGYKYSFLFVFFGFFICWLLTLSCLFFYFKRVQVVLKHSSECSLSFADHPSFPSSPCLPLSFLFVLRSCRLEDSVHLLPNIA